ncbi:Aldehyde dehydrogenase [Mycena kentingensis (nom. inval.)]|nr:Aldehyde dehydrogenase [Mycena kentingensis (nom. inval.)]
MGVDRHIRRGHPITFGLIILFGLFELALSAWLTSMFNTHHNQRGDTERDRVRFALFTSSWTVVLSTLILVLFWHSADGSVLTSILVHLVFLGFTWLMWAATAAAVTSMLGGGLNCKSGLHDGFAYCNQLNALEAFAWIEFILVTFAIVVVLVRGIQAARRGDGYRGGLVLDRKPPSSNPLAPKALLALPPPLTLAFKIILPLIFLLCAHATVVAFGGANCSGSEGKDVACDGHCIGVTGRGSFRITDSNLHSIAVFTGSGCGGTGSQLGIVGAGSCTSLPTGTQSMRYI